MNYEVDKNYYVVSDLGCSAAIISTGFELLDLDRTNPKKVKFIFQYKTGIQKIAGDYWSGKLMINARLFFDSTKALKNRLYSN